MHGDGVTVLFTTPDATRAALRTARQLTWKHGSPVRLVVMLPVPYPLPLANPPVPLNFTEWQVRQLASQAPVETKIELYLCRDIHEALRNFLKPESLVILGARRRWWWGSQEQRLARWLQANGHSVVLTAPAKEEESRRALSHNVLQFRMPNSSH
ncbi:MAG: hypothetical protein ABFD89_20625 [Bryobacteraceae bacterium]